MATVEQNAEAEADKKHLTGARRQAYIGGAFHRAAAWHDRATTPKTGAGAKHLSRRAKRMALADERQGEENRARIREMQTNAGKFRLKALRQRELPGNSGTAPTAPVVKPVAQKVENAPKPRKLTNKELDALARDLRPIKPLPAMDLDATRDIDPYFIREYYGDKQIDTALTIQTPDNLRGAVRVVERKTGKQYHGPRSHAAMKAWILANMDGYPASAPAPQPAAKEQAAAPSAPAKRETWDAPDLYDPFAPIDIAKESRRSSESDLRELLQGMNRQRLIDSARANGVSATGSKQDIIKRLMAKARG